MRQLKQILLALGIAAGAITLTAAGIKTVNVKQPGTLAAFVTDENGLMLHPAKCASA